MSAARANKAASASAAKANISPAQAPFDAGAPKAADLSPAAAPGSDAQEQSGPKRHQMTQILGIDISNARCHSHMKSNLIDAETEARLADRRAALKRVKEEAKAAGGDPKASPEATEIQAEIDTINKNVVRIGGDAPIAMATIGDYVAKSMIKYAMDQTLVAERKMVEVCALHGGSLSELDVWPLIRDLPSITTYDPDTEETLRKERAAQNKAAKEAREVAKKAREAGEEATLAAGGKPPADGDADSEEGDHHNVTTTFNTYVDNVTKTVKSEEAYKAMRVSNRLREVVSNTIAELVASLSRVAKVAVLDLLQVRTLTADHLLSMVKAIYVYQDDSEEVPGLDDLLGCVRGKVALYEEHLKAEKARKEEEMDPEKKAELEAKKQAAEKEKMKARAASAKKKALDAAQLAKKLSAEAAV